MMSGTLTRLIPILAPFGLYMVQSWPVFGSDTGVFANRARKASALMPGMDSAMT
jgi:hypothetical protein